MLTNVVLSLLLAALTGVAADSSKGINPVQHSELSAPVTTTTNASKGINPVQHSE